MAGELKLAIILTATMRGAQAFDRAGRGMTGMTAAMGHLTAAIKLFAIYAAFDFLRDSIETFKKFEQTMAEAGSIIGASSDQIAYFSDEVREMSKVLPKSADDLGTALYDIFSAGITDSADALATLELSAKAAVAGLTETATAAKAGIATMNAFGMEASDLSHIFDVQFLTIRYGILRYEELANVVGQMAPAAKQAGQSMESMFASLALLTKKGLDARKAAVALARAMEGITRPAAIEAARELGVSFVEMTPSIQAAWDELNKQKIISDELAASYENTESAIKSLGDEMRSVSLEQQKNRLEVMKIRQKADDQGREMTENEEARVTAIEEANDRLAITYQELSISQTEARIQSDAMNEKLTEQKMATDAAREAFEGEIATGAKFRPLVDIVAELGEKMEGLDEVAKAEIVSRLFPQIRARRAILSIMGSEEELIKMTEEMENQAGAMGEAYDINADTTANAMQLMTNAVDDMKIEIATALLPVMEDFMVIVQEDIVPLLRDVFIPLFKDMLPILRFFLGIISEILGFFVQYPGILKILIAAFVAWKIATLALNLALMANPIGLIAIAIIALIIVIVLLIEHWDEFKEAMLGVWDTWVGFGKAIMDALQPIIDSFDGIKKAFVSFGEGVLAALQPIIDFLELIKEAIEAIEEPLGAITGGFEAGLGEIGGALGFQKGGIVTRPTLATIGEAGPEAVIPLKGGAVPVEFIGGAGEGGDINTNDTYNISLSFPNITDAGGMSNGVDELMKEIRRRKKRGE